MLAANRGDRAVVRGTDHQLHFHCLDHDQRLALLHALARLDEDFPDIAVEIGVNPLALMMVIGGVKQAIFRDVVTFISLPARHFFAKRRLLAFAERGDIGGVIRQKLLVGSKVEFTLLNAHLCTPFPEGFAECC